MADLINPNPEVFERKERVRPTKRPEEPLDSGDIFEFIRDIQDPEHPYSLEQLNVVQEGLITICHEKRLCRYGCGRLHAPFHKGFSLQILLYVCKTQGQFTDEFLCLWNFCIVVKYRVMTAKYLELSRIHCEISVSVCRLHAASCSPLPLTTAAWPL
jgi:hypothetical protein